MDARAFRELLILLKQQGSVKGHFLGFLYLFIGLRLARSDGTEISAGMSWRDLSSWLKKIRWEKDYARELGLEPSKLPPRDRERFWYAAISRAKVDSPEAAQAGEKFAEILRSLGYVIGPPPGAQP